MGLRLSSEYLRVNLKVEGAELASVTNGDGIEYMWQAKPEIWPRHAPILFPIVGKLKEDKYFFEEQAYQLGQHGFARDKKFTVSAYGENFCTFILANDEQTQKVYPFDFDLEISYKLEKNDLRITYLVYNPSDKELLFSIGAHPGFNCPILPNESFEDYFLEFEKDDFILTKLSKGLILKGKERLHLTDGRLQLSEKLFENDALVFENYQINRITLASKKSNYKVTLHCYDWPNFGIWAKKGSREFICLEPWYGIADTADSNQKLTDKKGIRSLKPEGIFKCTYALSFE